MLFKQCHLEKSEIGTIELKQDCVFVAIPKNKASIIVDTINNTRLKKKKVRVYTI